MRTKDEFDAEDIGTLAVPPPTLTDLATDIAHGYAFLRDLDDDDERAVATCRGQDSPLVLRLLQHLPGQRLHTVGLY